MTPPRGGSGRGASGKGSSGRGTSGRGGTSSGRTGSGRGARSTGRGRDDRSTGRGGTSSGRTGRGRDDRSTGRAQDAPRTGRGRDDRGRAGSTAGRQPGGHQPGGHQPGGHQPAARSTAGRAGTGALAGRSGASRTGAGRTGASRTGTGRGGSGGARRSPPVGRGLGGDQVEGRQAVRELLLAGRRRVREVWMVDEGDDAPILDDIRELAAAGRVAVTPVGRGRFAAQARCEAPQGVLALAAPLPEADLDDLVATTPSGRARTGPPPFLVALDGVTDPGNLGAILRSAECAGVTGAILPRHRAVHVTPAATKAAAGAIEHVPMAVVGGLPAALAKLRDAGVHLIGLDGAATTSLYDVVGADGPVCLVLGAEGRGLSRLVAQRCDEVVAIPMWGALGSLNVSAAAALACYEVARRRAEPEAGLEPAT